MIYDYMFDKFNLKDTDFICCYLPHQATEIYERLERLRVEKSAESLKKFCAFERQYLENRLKNLEQWETGAVQALNPVADADSFVERHKKPSEALRRSYAVHILHLNHLSR